MPGSRSRGNWLGVPIEPESGRWTPTIAALLGLGIVASGQLLRLQLGIAPSVDAVHTWVEDLGWRAPAAFVGLVTIRQLLLLPAVLLLTAGGLVFGSGLGTALGGTGIICSAVFNFALARRIGAAVLPGRMGERLRYWSSHGPLTLLVSIALITAYPVGPMVAAQWTAGCSTLRFSSFLAAITPTSYVRAAVLAVFGASLTWGSTTSIVLTALGAAVIVLPLASPSLRRRLSGPPS